MEKAKLKKLASKSFPHRPDCVHSNEKKYSWNDINQIVREAMSIAHDWIMTDLNKKLKNEI